MRSRNSFPPLENHPEPGHAPAGPGRQAFTVWAPMAGDVHLEFMHPQRRRVPMERTDGGYWRVEAEANPGDLYLFVLDSKVARPDPASHHQPRDVHGPSAVVDHDAHLWACHDFEPPALADLILYEMHVGTFTPQGTFEAAAGRLDHLAALGVTALQVMPVCQFPGPRNWGYDGVQPYSVHNAYGGPDGFKRFVDAAHARGLAVILDVVFNHLGPEGNYLPVYGPYFTEKYKTPWGPAMNLDGPHSDHVRAYFLHNLLHWMRRYRVDGFRLDATHAYHDERPDPFMRRMGELARAFTTAAGVPPLFIAENDLNDPRVAAPIEQGGMGLSCQFAEDFHHGVHALLTGEREAYYGDFGLPEHVAKAVSVGYAYTGEYSVYRQRSHGQDPSRLPPESLAAFILNHDQSGNRAQGERLSALVGFEALKAAAGLLLLSPYTPLLFMGDEYAENNPFLYFVSHLDQNLVESVRQGRKQEFADFCCNRPEPPDPSDPETFERSRLDWSKPERGRHRVMLDFHRELIRLRKLLARSPGRKAERPRVLAQGGGAFLSLHYPFHGGSCMLFNLSPDSRRVDFGRLRVTGAKLLDSADAAWGGVGPVLPGTPHGRAVMAGWSLAVYAAREAGGDGPRGDAGEDG